VARREFTRKTRAAAYLRCKGFCETCGARLKSGEAEYDHILPCALGGDITLDNCAVKCRVCHKTKTATDIGRIRKADRQGDKARGAVRPKGSFPRPAKEQKPAKFDLTQRRSLFTGERT
jgi:5-methylcytosine-specific restriction protein A